MHNTEGRKCIAAHAQFYSNTWCYSHAHLQEHDENLLGSWGVVLKLVTRCLPAVQKALSWKHASAYVTSAQTSSVTLVYCIRPTFTCFHLMHVVNVINQLTSCFVTVELAMVGMPSHLTGAAAKAHAAGIKSNLELAQAAAQALGDVPLFLSPCFVEHGPDERAVVLFVSYLCSRLLDVSKEDRAAQVIQSLFRKRRAQQPGAA